MAGGVEGTEETVSDLAPPVPHAFTADTLTTHVENDAGQSMDTALRLFGPLMLPHEVVHVYDVASASGVIEYVTPVCPHCPLAGPLIATGTFGSPLPIPFERTTLEVGQLLFATTDTDDPPGIVPGNCMLQEVVVPVTIAPATEVLHV